MRETSFRCWRRLAISAESERHNSPSQTPFSDFGFRASFGLRISDFGFDVILKHQLSEADSAFFPHRANASRRCSGTHRSNRSRQLSAFSARSNGT